jgi:hypothetical protein
LTRLPHSVIQETYTLLYFLIDIVGLKSLIIFPLYSTEIETLPKKPSTTLAMVSSRENKTSNPTSASNQPTTLPMLSVSREIKTSNASSSPEQPTTLTTLGSRKNETKNVTSPSIQHGTTMATLSARKNETIKQTPSSSKQPTTLAMLGYTERNTIRAKNPPTKQSRQLVTSEHSANRNSEKNKNRRSYVGAIKMDHFVVLVCVLVMGTVVLIYTIIVFIRRQNRPERVRHLCAGYNLVFTAPDEPASTGNEQQPPGSIQLTILTSS